MKPARISQAREVFNIHDGSQSWAVEHVFLDNSHQVAVVLVNNNPKAFNQKHCASEAYLNQEGYRGFA